MQRVALLGALALLLALPTAQGQTPCDDERCDKCDDSRINCTQCNEGLFLDRYGFCSPCKDPLCARCSSANRCLKCKPADFNADNQPLLYLSKDGQCKICPGQFDPNDGPCVECGRDGKCSTCNEGYYLDEKKNCKRCADPLCERCTAKGCIKCVDSFSNPDSFSEFPEVAVYMDEKGVCKKCTDNPWSSGCTACDRKGRCTKCGDEYGGGHTLDKKAGKCVKCDDSLCAVCDTANPSRCITCQTEPYWNWDTSYWGPVYFNPKTQKCTECSKHQWYHGCKKCDTRGQCAECDKYTFLNRGACTPCSAALEHCSRCNTIFAVCLECEDGYGTNGGFCRPCKDPLCKKCGKFDQCKQCKEGAYLSSTGECKEKPVGCDQVRPNGKCNACRDGYRMAKGVCVKCVGFACIPCQHFACRKCDKRRQWCIDCSDLPQASKNCRRCSDKFCQSCQNDHEKCTACLPEITLKPGNTQRGIYRDKGGSCRLCSEGCQSCSTAGVCDSCATGYAKVGNVCTRCADPLCQSCSRGPTGPCDYCFSPEFDTYVAQDGKCAKAVKGCSQHTARGACKECKYGWTLRGGSCQV